MLQPLISVPSRAPCFVPLPLQSLLEQTPSIVRSDSARTQASSTVGDLQGRCCAGWEVYPPTQQEEVREQGSMSQDLQGAGWGVYPPTRKEGMREQGSGEALEHSQDHCLRLCVLHPIASPLLLI